MSPAHLGALVTPFVDGELNAARAAEARAHLAACAECRQAVAAEQVARRRTQDSVRGMQASPELTARLLAMPSGPAAAAIPLERSRRGTVVLGGGAALVGLFVLTLFVLGTPHAAQSPGSLLAATTEVPNAAVQQAGLSAADVDGVSAVAWAVPASLTIQRLDLVDEQGTQTLDVSLDTAAGDVRLLERPGTLDEGAAAAGATPSTVAGHVVYRVDGWYLLESGSCVVAVLGETDEAAELVIADLPEPDGFLDRIADGWLTLVG